MLSVPFREEVRLGASRHRRGRLEGWQGERRDGASGASAHDLAAGAGTERVAATSESAPRPMTTIDFYTHCADRFDVASKLVAKAWAQHGTVRVLTDGARATDEFGRYRGLWRRPASCRIASWEARSPPKRDVVDHVLDHEGPAAVLAISMHWPPPSFPFERLAEIVSLDEAEVAAAASAGSSTRHAVTRFAPSISRRDLSRALGARAAGTSDVLMRQSRPRDRYRDSGFEGHRDGRASPGGGAGRARRRARAYRGRRGDRNRAIVELPEDIDESSGWLHHDHGE